MELIELRNRLTASLSHLYEMEAIRNLVELWQGELHVLQYIFHHSDAEINPSVLSAALHVSRARITSTLAGLRNKGYISMEMSTEDRRRMRVFITSEGETYLQKKMQRVEKHFEVLVSGLGVENVKEFIKMIDLTVNTMEKENNQEPGALLWSEN